MSFTQYKSKSPADWKFLALYTFLTSSKTCNMFKCLMTIFNLWNWEFNYILIFETFRSGEQYCTGSIVDLGFGICLLSKQTFIEQNWLYLKNELVLVPTETVLEIAQRVSKSKASTQYYSVKRIGLKKVKVAIRVD